MTVSTAGWLCFHDSLKKENIHCDKITTHTLVAAIASTVDALKELSHDIWSYLITF